MNFYGALLAWFVIAGLMVAAVILAVNGSVWILGLALLAFIVAFAKFGCLSH